MYSTEKTRKWFDDYVDTFRIDGKLSDKQELKRQHSLRVMQIACQIAEANEWHEENDLWLAHAIGLLHDTARFEQCRDYDTFSDAVSFDHGTRGAEILAAEFDWSGIDKRDREKVLKAVYCHNKPTIPSDISLSLYRWCALARDADKIDVCCMAKERFMNGTISGMLHNDNSESRISPALADEIRRTGVGSYKNARNSYDYGLILLTWAFDLNFPVSIATLKNEKVFDLFAHELKGHGEDELVSDIYSRIEKL